MRFTFRITHLHLKHLEFNSVSLSANCGAAVIYLRAMNMPNNIQSLIVCNAFIIHSNEI